MGSYCTIYFDELRISSAKSAVPDDFSAIFQESDRLVRKSQYEEDDTPEVVYEATKATVLARLDLLGCTSRIARERLSKWITEERAKWAEYASEYGNWAEETAMALRKFTIEEWYRCVPLVLATKYDQDEPEPIDEIDRAMTTFKESWLWFDGYDSLVGFRALLDANPNVEKVTLDVSDLIQAGWLDPNEQVCQGSSNKGHRSVGPLTPTVILAEGRSDINILKNSLSILFPDRKDYFSFFEHDELNVDGGAIYLVKFLKAFAAARTPLRLVAIFDNDTVGRQAYQQAQDLDLPDNMILLRLPDIELARRYPTIGPQGLHEVNVNGQAASIELYLGRAALSVNGKLRRVRWTGYDKTADAYQGEVEAKNEVKQHFFKHLETFADCTAAQSALPELVDLWKTIFSAVEHSAEEVERRTINYRWYEN